jgi:hypothetical protein
MGAHAKLRQPRVGDFFSITPASTDELAQRLFWFDIEDFDDFRRDAGQRAARPIQHITVAGRPDSRLFEVGDAGLESENSENFGIVDIAEQAADILAARGG